ncbi:hypothetical protein FHW36_11821 [Chitinophaga polysaccharea]|uniref:Uncharacterized protein n=1 Tax=Chitinophaga polysaccharea TaxID=1293035 RepID=A0A561P0S7_9BACT|nr:hypothetical protein [Chitinophaga polysaccharea]TWF31727.1 hypothetical protein FHW36_11821 [Chitinophaga polysaccharea]
MLNHYFDNLGFKGYVLLGSVALLVAVGCFFIGDLSIVVRAVLFMAPAGLAYFCFRRAYIISVIRASGQAKKILSFFKKYNLDVDDLSESEISKKLREIASNSLIKVEDRNFAQQLLNIEESNSKGGDA